MSPSSRQIFIWSLPTLFLLSFLWYKRKKSTLQSDPGGTEGKSKVIGLNGITASVAVQKSVVETQQKSAVPEVREKNFEACFVATSDSAPSNTLSLSEELGITDSKLTTSAQPEEIKCNGKLSFQFTVENLEKSSTLSVAEEQRDLIIAETAASETCGDHSETDQIPDNLTEQEVHLETSLSVSSGANDTTPSEVQAVLVDKEAHRLIEINEEPVTKREVELNFSSEEDIQQGSLNNSLLNSSWAAECELELDEDRPEDRTIVEDESESVTPQTVEMARELSSEVSLKAENPVEETRSGPTEEESLEEKMTTLDMRETQGKPVAAGNKVLGVKEHSGERDSANHSPSEVMLGSPSISNYSDVQSEGSSDSGKGCSDVATPPSRTPVSGSSVSGDAPTTTVYEFVLPQMLVGRLIGRHGIFVHQIKTKTQANLLIKRHPDTHKLKICAIEGSQLDVENALEMIRLKFPIKRYPNVTLEQVSFASASMVYPSMPDSFQLQLIEGVNNDVILSSLVTPGHFFLQQPTHPTYPALNRLNICMNYCYNDSAAPALPLPIEASAICVAPTMGGWYRAQVMSSSTDSGTSDVKFIDYGGYQTVDNSLLRQIRSDFIALPFQAAECYLANVKPRDGVWPYEALSFVEELTHGQVLQAQIYGYANDGVPVVFLYSIQGAQVLVVNRELVDRGYAEWDEPTEEPEPVTAEALADTPLISA